MVASGDVWLRFVLLLRYFEKLRNKIQLRLQVTSLQVSYSIVALF